MALQKQTGLQFKFWYVLTVTHIVISMLITLGMYSVKKGKNNGYV